MSAINITSGSTQWPTTSSAKGPNPRMQEKMMAKADADGSGGISQSEFQTTVSELAKKTGISSDKTAEQLFAASDSNGDGSLTSSELGAAVKSLLPPPSTMEFAQSRSSSSSVSSVGQSDSPFSQVDADGNGSINTSELSSMMSQGGPLGSQVAAGASTEDAASDMVAKLDANGDGELSQSEFDAGRPDSASGTQGAQGSQGPQGPKGPGGARPPPPPSGSSSSSTTYDELDTNEDGVVSAAEQAAGAEADPLQALMTAVDSNQDGSVSTEEVDSFAKQLTTQLQAAAQAYSETAQSGSSALAAQSLGSTFSAQV